MLHCAQKKSQTYSSCFFVQRKKFQPNSSGFTALRKGILDLYFILYCTKKMCRTYFSCFTTLRKSLRLIVHASLYKEKSFSLIVHASLTKKSLRPIFHVYTILRKRYSIPYAMLHSTKKVSDLYFMLHSTKNMFPAYFSCFVAL